MDVTLWTKCWEKDYLRVLGGGARIQADRCNHQSVGVFVNNVLDRIAVERVVAAAIVLKKVDRVVFVDEVADRVLDFFKVTREDLGRGYVYSICEMAEILATDTTYLLHFAGDVALTRASNWIPRAIEILEEDPAIAVVNPLWNESLSFAAGEAFRDGGDRGDHFVGYGFSDQCYLIRVADFRADMLREKHPAGVRYPFYGGELFEKRVDAWMRNHGRFRATLKEVSYAHPWNGLAIDAAEVLSNLWVGSVPPEGLSLSREGFTDLYLCARQVQPEESRFPGVSVHRVLLDDAGFPPTAEEVEEAGRAGREVADLLAKGSRVLVTCHKGMNRSGLVAAIGVYFSSRRSGCEAMNLVRSRRVGALQNLWFQSILIQLPARARAL